MRNKVREAITPARQPERVPTHRQEPHPAQAVVPQVAYRRVQRNGDAPRPADLLALQRAVGNHGVQRKVKLDGKTWLKTYAKLPAIPAAMAERYENYVVEQVTALAATWRDDEGVTNRTFASADAFYQTLFDRVVTQGQPTQATTGDRWKHLKSAVEKAGSLTEVAWAAFSAAEAALLAAELMACEVQVSSNPSTTACHGNTHHKLPKKVAAHDQAGDPAALADLPPAEQPDQTPYIEFLVAGHKSETGIERGILDKDSGLIYLTAHYDKGSIVWLSGAPAALVGNWQAKALTYCNDLKGQ